jgi:hypothetical protein
MAEIGVPKNVLEEVMGSMRRLHHRPFKFFLNRPQKVSSWIAAVAVVGVCLFVLLFSQVSWPEPQWPGWVTLAQLSAMVLYVSLMVATVAAAVPSFRDFISPDRSLLAPVVGAFDEERGLIVRLAQHYERHDLEYGLDRTTLVVTQLRSRLALVIGALDKVGLFPLLIGAYFSLRELLQDQPPTSSELAWLVGGALGVAIAYGSGLLLLIWAQDLEDMCLVLKHAVQAKPKDARG